MMIIVLVGSRHSIHLWIAQCYQTHHSPRWLKTTSKIARHTVVPNVKNPPNHKFAQGGFTSFSMELPFPVTCASHSKVVKPLQAQVWFVDFTNFLNLVFGGFLQYDPTLHPAAAAAVYAWSAALRCLKNLHILTLEHSLLGGPAQLLGNL